jgi:serine/threonine-protein kinase
MTRLRAPLWLLLAAASFPVYFGLLMFCDLTRPEFLGVRFRPGGLVVEQVVLGSPAARAGFTAGDELVGIDGQRIAHRLDLEALALNIELDQPRVFAIVRGGTPGHLSVTLGPTPSSYWRSREGVVLLGLRTMQGVTLAFALVIAFRRPRDPVALAGAWLLAGAGVFCIALPYRTALVWRHLPFPVGLLLWLPFLSAYAGGALSYVFFSLFPNRRRRSAIVWAASLAPMAAALGLYATSSVRTVYTPDHVTGGPTWPFTLLLGVNGAYLAAGLVTLLWNYRQLTDVNERRRVRVLVIGSCCAGIGGIPVIFGYWHSAADLSHSMFASGGITAGTLVFLLFPLSFTYAILRHRLFDLSVIIRQGVRYALARRALLSLVPVLGLVLALDVVLHGDQPLMDVLRTRGVVYLAIGALAVAAHLQRPRWLDGLDRRFFRERYDARQILARLVADIRQVGSFDRVAPRAVAQIAAALHPEFAALLVRQPGEQAYGVAAAAPPALTLPALSAETTLIRLVRVLGKPIEVSRGDTDWLRDQLPAAEISLLRDARIDLVVPITSRSAPTEALLALGMKRSEEPYGREDLDLLATIAESLALLLDRAAAATPSGDALAECPTCGTCYQAGVGHCAREGAALAVSRLPRVLAARYRIERRLGRGGMGTVYEARDLALDRAVAAKVMREDLVGSAEAAERFQREARSAARLTHPNVVTVHDFGVTPEHVAYLVMELLDGVTLRTELRRCTRVPAPRALALMRDVAAAVDAAHGQRIIHRDLKPENIFLVRTASAETAKVVDFGIAKSLELESVTGELALATNPAILLGTPRYMAPEQLRGEEPHASWDLWALAIVAYEMLTGVHPFAGTLATAAPGGAAAYEAHLAARLNDLPAGSLAFFVRALAPDPVDRPGSAPVFLAEFERALAPADA